MTRLIDADALKKEIEGLVVGGEEGLKNYYENGSKSDENSWIGGVYDAYELIDNAPTVFDSKAYSQGYKQGVCDERNARPLCKTDTKHGTWLKYCPINDKWLVLKETDNEM